ncbi:MAG: hypothetical protein RIQ33_2185 [Bacteroidota bacterium]|jgi:hypothetical protein
MDTGWIIIYGFAAFLAIGSLLYVKLTDHPYNSKEKKAHQH